MFTRTGNLFRLFHIVSKSGYQDQVHPSVCLSVHLSLRLSCFPHVRLPWDGFSLNLILGTFMKICQELQIKLKSDKNIGEFIWILKYISPMPARKPSIDHFCAILNIFIQLAVTCSSTIHMEHIVVFQLQKYLCESATMLYYTYSA